MPEFAPGYERTEEGWVVFPRDADLRRELFDPVVMKHPAKFNLHLVTALVEYLTKSGDVILDPFGGSGSLMVAVTQGRKVRLIELEEHYFNTLQDSREKFLARGECAPEAIDLKQGDCRQVLPLACSCVITSPPYANISRTSPLEDIKGEILNYINHPRNLGRLNDFFFLQAMEGVYQKLALSLPQDAPMVIITRDAMEKDHRKLLSDGVIRQAVRNGFTFAEWIKHKPPGSKQGAIQKSRGFATVEDEDILLFRRT